MNDKSEFLFGINLINEVLLNRPEEIISLHINPDKKNNRIESVLDNAKTKDIPISTEDENFFINIDGSRNSDICIKCKVRKEEDERFLESLLGKEQLLILILDHLTDPHNVGACLRSAAASGADAVIAPKNRSCHLTPTVRRVSSGGSELIPFVVVTNLARTLKNLNKNGIDIIGTDLSSESSYNEVKYQDKVAFVIGSEDRGMKRLTKENCNYIVNIPMKKQIDSLNASVTTGIILFEFRRQKSNKPNKIN
ncbi:MAG: 23S rRNA (guanosine(2251)-2'-O)-methyltransferase RlmB [Gammaproteobacteria bacterium]